MLSTILLESMFNMTKILFAIGIIKIAFASECTNVTKLSQTSLSQYSRTNPYYAYSCPIHFTYVMTSQGGNQHSAFKYWPGVTGIVVLVQNNCTSYSNKCGHLQVGKYWDGDGLEFLLKQPYEVLHPSEQKTVKMQTYFHLDFNDTFVLRFVTYPTEQWPVDFTVVLLPVCRGPCEATAGYRTFPISNVLNCVKCISHNALYNDIKLINRTLADYLLCDIPTTTPAEIESSAPPTKILSTESDLTETTKIVSAESDPTETTTIDTKSKISMPSTENDYMVHAVGFCFMPGCLIIGFILIYHIPAMAGMFGVRIEINDFQFSFLWHCEISTVLFCCGCLFTSLMFYISSESLKLTDWGNVMLGVTYISIGLLALFIPTFGYFGFGRVSA